jgi:hypothetical protein
VHWHDEETTFITSEADVKPLKAEATRSLETSRDIHSDSASHPRRPELTFKIVRTNM